MPIATGRPETLAPNGMVTSPHSLASAAGVDVLRAGGSAVDAAIATSAVLAVVYPHMTSIGGDAFWLVHEGKTGRIRFLDGGGRAAARADIGWFRDKGMSEIPFRGIAPATLTVPGAVASWAEVHSKFGRLSLSRALEAAVGYARDGFPVTERLAGFMEMVKADLAPHADTKRIFMKNGDVPKAGTKLSNPDLARSLEAIGRDGWAGFYDGEVAQELARFSEENGGFFRKPDLAAQKAIWGEPISSTYRDVTIYNTPPPTQGFAVLSMLNLIEPFELHKRPFLGPDHIHLLVQAKQLAYHDRDQHIGDPRFVDVPIERLISKAYANERRAHIDINKALPWDKVPSYGSLKGDTIYIAAVDKDGNAVSLIQSLYGVFGSGVVAGKTGIVLQNRSAYFNLDPKHPNALAPGKTPLHTLIASMGKRDGKLWSVLGCMGADGQPQIQLQAYVGLIDYGLNIQQALEMPRFLSGRFGLGEARDTLHIEARYPADTLATLDKRGHILNRWGDWCEMAGHAHGIIIDQKSGLRHGGSDPRSDGAAIGY